MGNKIGFGEIIHAKINESKFLCCLSKFINEICNNKFR